MSLRMLFETEMIRSAYDQGNHSARHASCKDTITGVCEVSSSPSWLPERLAGWLDSDLRDWSLGKKFAIIEESGPQDERD